MADRDVESCRSDLEWYFNWSDGDLCSPSNFMAMVAAITLGRAHGTRNVAPEIVESRLQASRKARDIARALDQLSAPQRRVLFLAFGPAACVLPILGNAAPVALLTATAQAAHRESHSSRSLEDWLVRLTHRASKRLGAHVEEDRATARAIASEANGALTWATRAFVEAFVGRPGKEAGRDQVAR